MLKKNIKFKNTCDECSSYNAIVERVLIIKFASAGDVLRTTAILPALKKKYPSSFITWLVQKPSEELLEGISYIDRILIYDLSSVPLLQAEKFDLVISLDKATEAVSLATLIKAEEKYGYGLSEEGKICPFNKEAEYSFLLGLDDDLKFYKNKKTYQELIYEAAKLTYSGQKYELRLSLKDLNFAERFFLDNNLNNNAIVIGINTGAGKVFANKMLKPRRIIELIKILNQELDAKILLLGGPLEKEVNEYIVDRVGFKIFNSGCAHNLKEFSALINKCALVITADTLALHIAIALKRPVVAIFGPTCSQEIDLYKRGHKVITEANCAPCYKNKCTKEVTCMDKINLTKIIGAAKRLIESKAVCLNQKI